MGIYIKGAKMPHPGEYFLILKVSESGKDSAYIFSSDDELIKSHEAIEIQPHGRLGDLDKLEDNLRLCAEHQEGFRQGVMLGCCETIRMTKEILPAETENKVVKK